MRLKGKRVLLTGATGAKRPITLPRLLEGGDQWIDRALPTKPLFSRHQAAA